MKSISLLLSISIIFTVTSVHGQPRHSDKKKIDNHKIVIKEVVQTTNYTYLNVNEDDKLVWLAIPLSDAKPGETYYYTGAVPMYKFESKELHKTFDSVLFLGGLSPEPITELTGKKPMKEESTKPYTRTAPTALKKEIKISPAKGGITISELLSHKDKYAGKTVIIKGEVTKYNAQIMDKNWIHLQDGTENDGKFDLMVTSNKEVKVGETVTLEGTISLNKDFGYGYFFEVLMEDATIK